jgi:hypothetical protein
MFLSVLHANSPFRDRANRERRTTVWIAATVLVLWLFVDAIPKCCFAQTCDQTARFTRPIPLGISGGNSADRAIMHGRQVCFGGTLGALVMDTGGTRYILGSSTSLALGNRAAIGAKIVQPSLADRTCKTSNGNVVATLSKSVKLLFSPHAENLEDAAIAEVKPNEVSSQILNIGEIASTVATPQLMMSVQKMGEATCLTTGTITAVNVNFQLIYRRPKRKKRANFTNQIAITSLSSTIPFAGGGDSGAVILTTDTCPEPVALQLGTGTFGVGMTVSFASPIQPVLDALNVNFVGGCSTGSSVSHSDETSDGQDDDPTLQQAVNAATAVRDAHAHDLMKIPGAVGTGIGIDSSSGAVEIQVYVKDLGSTNPTPKDSTIDSIPVVIEDTGEIIAR